VADVSVDGHSTVNKEFLARDVARSVAHEEDSDVGDLLWLGDVTERDALPICSTNVVAPGGRIERSLRSPWRQGVHADSMVTHF